MKDIDGTLLLMMIMIIRRLDDNLPLILLKNGVRLMTMILMLIIDGFGMMMMISGDAANSGAAHLFDFLHNGRGR